MNPLQSIHDWIGADATLLVTRTLEHLMLTGFTIVCASILGIALAVLAHRYVTLRSPLLALTGVMQTIPSIALLVIAMGIFGRIGNSPALMALIVYALLPIVQNTLIGLQTLSPQLQIVARGMGMTRWQRLRYVRFPLAAPMVLAGIRIAAVQTVGLATLAAFVGAGGLGQFVNRGLFLSDMRLIMLGAVPAAALALLLHGVLSMALLAITPVVAYKKRMLHLCGVAGFICFVIVMSWVKLLPSTPTILPSITIGSKNFTEQLIVAEMIAQQLEQTGKFHVIRRFGLGGTMVLHKALVTGSIDLAVEYTGTALTSALKLPIPEHRNTVFATVKEAYKQQYGLVWLSPLGFDNSYRLAVRQSIPPVKTMSELIAVAPNLKAGFDFEFAQREDGYAGLRKYYGLVFASVVDMHPDVLYKALLDGSVDVISAYATDGRLEQKGVQVLEDDKHFFPPYEAAIVVRSEKLMHLPELKTILDKFSGSIKESTMRKMNAAVDSRAISVEQAAHNMVLRH